ncbi:MAG: trypsin-like peptidase domain-containing protein [Oribacterium parvum]|uniref:S1C family serine protease n=1 Tax=Oribacterium parvum TaxID=1501329 RepID=UPI001CB165C5|nr:trypsin-like peptidase domain-containing protein [Oribacterium parvum]MBF1268357.1 trypsin-like peptidase domain-containing protein [Oribacterium parvum]
MKRIIGVIFSALLFGLIAGGMMVGVNYIAQERNIYSIAEEGQPKQEEKKESSPSEIKEPEKSTVPSDTIIASTGNGKTVTEVAKDAMPSVVAITNMMRYQENGFSIFGEIQRETELPASGSGVIVGQNDTELLIATNNHVIQDSNSLTVSFIDDSTATAQVKGTDVTVDLALVSVKLSDISPETREKIKAVQIGSSDEMEVGDQVVAIGNALGYGQSVTTGIISAKNRDVQTKDGVSKGLIQTDAAINPGNSGGALLNMKGELIGINVAKYADTDVEGMGYSIPSSAAETILSSLSTLTTRDKVPEAEQGVLGIQVKDIDAQTAESFAMPKGIYIFKVLDDTGADNSQIQERDIITKLDGQGVYTTANLKALLSKYRAGEEVKLTLMRQDGTGKYNEVEATVTLGKSPAPNGNGDAGNSGEAPSENNTEESQEGASNGENPEYRNKNGNESNEKNGEDNPFKSFQDFFNEYKR